LLYTIMPSPALAIHMMRGMKCYGSTVIGEKGQVVIPADVRKQFHIKTGDKFLVLAGHKGLGIMLLKTDALAKMVKNMFGDNLQGLLGAELVKISGPKAGKKTSKKSGSKRGH
jgi:AbrB family looped-hinge helix DNA binding protein